MIIWIILGAAGLWVLGGCVCLWVGGRPRGKEFRRSLKGLVRGRGGRVEALLTITPPISREETEPRDVVLALDHSSSMGGLPGSPMAEALRAAENFVRSLPGCISLSLVGFNHQAAVLCPLGSSQRQLISSLNGITGSGGTALDQAIIQARKALRKGRPGVAKTIILLSDGESEEEPAMAQAAALSEEAEPVELVCLGFGADAGSGLLSRLAGEERYFQIEDAKSLGRVFDYLVQSIGGNQAAGGDIAEEIPWYFEFASSEGLHPTGLETGPPLKVHWPATAMSLAPVKIEYSLVSRRCGWFSVGGDSSQVRWRMRDGELRKTPGPSGPRVLILPAGLEMFWPILNPLFWMLASAFFRKAHAEPKTGAVPSSGVEYPEPPPVLPLLEIPEAEPPVPALEPALILGMGPAGEWTLVRLKERIRTQGAMADKVRLLSLYPQSGRKSNKAQCGLSSLTQEERLDTAIDLRPLLEKMRVKNNEPGRQWVPVEDWLGDGRPQDTVRSDRGDRRRARLALTESPHDLERIIGQEAERLNLPGASGLVLITGAVDDPGFSGCLAEAAHIAAGYGLRVWAVISPGEPHAKEPEAGYARQALAMELERLALLKREEITSLRGGSRKSTHALIDRIILAGEGRVSARRAGLDALEVIWAALALPQARERIGKNSRNRGRLECPVIKAGAGCFPLAALRERIHDQTLARVINGQWLELTPHQGHFVLPRPGREEIDLLTARFWQSSPEDHRFSQFASRSFAAAGDEFLSPLTLIAGIVDPMDPYHVRAENCTRQINDFRTHLAHWAGDVLYLKSCRGGLLVTLWMAAESIATHFHETADRLSQAAIGPETDLARGLALGHRQAAEELAGELKRWLAGLAGPMSHKELGSAPLEHLPCALYLEQRRRLTASALDPPGPQAEADIETWQEQEDAYFSRWLEEGLVLQFVASQDHFRLIMRLPGSEQAAEPAEAASRLRRLMALYHKRSAAWSGDAWLNHPAPEGGPVSFFIGNNKRRDKTGPVEILEPGQELLAGWWRVDRSLLHRAFHADIAPKPEHPFIWPEEANAARLAERLRNTLNLEPRPFTPQTVHLMRDPEALWRALGDIAAQRLKRCNQGFELIRAGEEYSLAVGLDWDDPAQELFALLRQVVSLKQDQGGRSIPPGEPWFAGPGQALSKLADTTLMGRVLTNKEGREWEGIIKALALDQGGSIFDPGPPAAISS